ncbi:MAG: DUF4235 domain-containing protein [Acidimicrobiia bacterium]
MKKVSWNVVAGLAALGAGWAARQAATAVWHRMSEVDAPEDPADRSVSWAQAAGWAVLAGLCGAVAQLIARRGTAAAWEGVTGEVPPGLA